MSTVAIHIMQNTLEQVGQQDAQLESLYLNELTDQEINLLLQHIYKSVAISSDSPGSMTREQTSPDDEIISLDALTNERKAWADEQLTALWDNHWNAILAYCINKIGSETGEDIAQRAFIKTYVRLLDPKFTGTVQKAYLYRVAENIMADNFRQRGNRRRIENENIPPQQDVDSILTEDIVMLRIALQSAFSEMNSRQKIVIKALMNLPLGRTKNFAQALGIREIQWNRLLAQVREIVQTHLR
jgi:RNA polymerase sigma factor (sigma-70 family)